MCFIICFYSASYFLVYTIRLTEPYTYIWIYHNRRHAIILGSCLFPEKLKRMLEKRTSNRYYSSNCVHELEMNCWYIQYKRNCREAFPCHFMNCCKKVIIYFSDLSTLRTLSCVPRGMCRIKKTINAYKLIMPWVLRQLKRTATA